MPEVKRQVKIVTEQTPIDKPSGVEGFPLRKWSMEIHLLNERGEEIDNHLFEKATYHLHPSFEARAKQVKKNPPFRIEEEGWGEFDLTIALTAAEKGGEHTVQHDLNFSQPRYESVHTITFKNPKPPLMNLLRESGPAELENGIKRKGGDAKKRKAGGGIQMETLADNLQKLSEDDLLHVVSLIHEHRTPDTYTKNDTEQGEFYVDLYTLSDSLLKMLWEYSLEKLGS